MARSRRARIPMGFGAGGRQALIGSLLPTAQEQAQKQASMRAADNAKVSAFNRGDITYDQLKAYFDERMGQVTDPAAKTEMQSLLENAKASDNKRKDNKAVEAATQAIKDFQSGKSSYADAVAAIKAQSSLAIDGDIKTHIDRLLDDAGTIRQQRDVNTKIEDYNKSKISYSDLRDFLQKEAESTTNDVTKQQIIGAIDGARATENKKVLTQAQGDLQNGTIDLGQYTQKLTELRGQPGQSPDATQQISAAIVMGEQHQQSIEDSKTYTAAVEHSISPEAALLYYNSRLANARDPKTVESLGKYAQNITQMIDNANKQASAHAGSLASQANAAAKTALLNATTTAKDLVKDYMDGQFKIDMKAATDTGNGALVMHAYQGLAQVKADAAGLGGNNSKQLGIEARKAADDGILMASVVVAEHYAKVTMPEFKKDFAAATTAEGKATLIHQMINASVKAQSDPYVKQAVSLDPAFASQEAAIAKTRMEVGIMATDLARQERDKFEASKLVAEAHLDNTIQTFVSSLTDAKALGKAKGLLDEMGVTKEDLAGGDVRDKIAGWIQSGDVTKHLTEILRATKGIGLKAGASAPSDDSIANDAITIGKALAESKIHSAASVNLFLAGGEAAFPGKTKPMSEISQQMDRGETIDPIDHSLVNATDPTGPKPTDIGANANFRENRGAYAGPSGQEPNDTLPFDSGVGKPREYIPGVGWVDPDTLTQGQGAPSLFDKIGGAFRGGLDALRSNPDAASRSRSDAAFQDIVNRASQPGFQTNTPTDQAGNAGVTPLAQVQGDPTATQGSTTMADGSQVPTYGIPDWTAAPIDNMPESNIPAEPWAAPSGPSPYDIQSPDALDRNQNTNFSGVADPPPVPDNWGTDPIQPFDASGGNNDMVMA